MRQRIIPILLLLCLSGCSDSSLKKVAQSLEISAKSIGIVQTTVIEANKQLLISDPATASILKVCLTVNQAGKDVISIIKPLTELDESSRQMILKVILPAVQSVQEMLDSNLLYIKNEESKQKVRAALLTVQTALSAIQLVVAGG